MRLKQINRLKESYILDESIKDLYFKMINVAEYLAERIENNRPKIVVENEIKKFVEEYKDVLASIRTIITYDKHARKNDPDRPTMMGISKLIHSSPEDTIKELEYFQQIVLPKNPKMKATFDHFVMMADKMAASERHGYKGADFVFEILELNDVIKSQIGEFYKANVKESIGITDAFMEMFEANYYEEELNEGKAEPDQYYMIVELSLYDSEKSESVPHKNFKNVLVTNAKSQAQARQKLKASANRSLKEMNKKLKERGMKCTFKKKEWFRECPVYKGYDSIKKKNIKSLSGSDSVSTGVYLLGGMCGHGTVGSLPEYAPNKYALHSSKSSLTRYLNKHCPLED